MKGLDVGIVGATGLVGREFLVLLEKRNFPIKSLRLFASSRSVGKKLDYKNKKIVVEDIKSCDFKNFDIVFFSAGKEVSKRYAPLFQENGVYVVDNSSAFRRDDNAPLIVPEINGDVLKSSDSKIISNPNCSTIIMLMAIYPIYKGFGIKEIVVSTYQAASGAGRGLVYELEEQMRAWVLGKDEQFNHYDRPLLLNLMPKIGNLESQFSFSSEEEKMIFETQKILNNKKIKVYPTTIRVPVERCHSESIFIKTEKSCSKDEILQALKGFSGVFYTPLPSPRELAKKEEVFVGRVRVLENNKVMLWAVSDQLWKGAALNAIQIGEKLVEFGKFS